MLPKNSFKWSLIAASIVATISLLVIVFSLTSTLPIRDMYTKPTSIMLLYDDLRNRNSVQNSYNLFKGLVSGNLVESIPVVAVLKQALLPVRVATIPAEQIGQAGVPAQTDPRLPVRLKIPKIKVDAAVEYVGLTPQGDMGVPRGLANVAWFDLGSIPGEIGSAVIAGHYGWKNDKSAAFDNVYKLHKGDRIYIQNAEGVTTSYVVREVRLYGEDEDASDVFDSDDGKAHLNLVTCEGVWSDARKSYSKRLVVFTDKE